ncbi:MAG: FAD-binding protein [Actinomycetota bacterium]
MSGLSGRGAPESTATERSLTGWGRTSPSTATVVEAPDVTAIAEVLRDAGPRGALARGLGRSYGDVAQNAGGVVLDMTACRGIERLDEHAGTLTALAGTSFDEILRAIVPRGWFVPVTPGTRSVTLGGAIANDVHGKNHHVEGSIGEHMVSLDLLSPADADARTVTPQDAAFSATVGGMGLTGVIVRATTRLHPIETSSMRVDTDRARDLDELMGLMAAGDERVRYSVAWIDGLARGKHLGRGVLTRGDHAIREEVPSRGDPLAYRPRRVLAVPPSMPGVVSTTAIRAFNEAWFRHAPTKERGRIQPLTPFFHPLDAVANWNRLYGRDGLLQYQFVVPFGSEDVVRVAIELLSGAGAASFLAVLKRFGPGRGGMSFPIEGWTLALDLPAGQRGLRRLLDRIDRIVADAGGRVYLAKDSRLHPALVREMYPELGNWGEQRGRLDPAGVLHSDLDRRLELHTRERRRVLA